MANRDPNGQTCSMSHDLSNPVEFSFICPLPNGLHARPASQLAKFASSFRSELHLTNLRTRATANLKSTLGILSIDVRAGDECSVRVLGADDQEAGAALRGYIAVNLANSDEPLAEPAAGTNHSNLPRALMANAASYHFGVVVSSGIGKGKAVVAGGISLPANLPEKADDPLKEQRWIERAVAALRERIRTLLSRSMSPTEAGVLKAHLGVLDDVAFTEKVSDAIAQGRSAGQAILETGQFFSGLLQHSESAYIRDRAVDIQEICLRLLEEIYGSMFGNAAIELTEPSVLVAETLAAQQLLTLERKWLNGLVLEYAGTTSHAVILARSLGIPAIVGVKDAPVVLSAAKDVVVDANRGFVVSNGSASVQRFYDREQHT
jgi:fructose-specific PTS system IIA-like component